MTIVNLLVAVGVAFFLAHAEPGARMAPIDDDPGFPIEMSELQELAFRFHQDWTRDFSDVHQVALDHVKGLSTARKALLRSQLLSFIDEIRSDDEVTRRKAWVAKGVASWPRDVDLVRTLTDFAGML